MIWRKGERSTLKGLITGLTGGVIASWVMNQSQGALGAVKRQLEESGDDSSRNGSRQENRQRQSSQEEPATVKAAVAVSEKVFRQRLEDDRKQAAGSAVHYAYGACVGGLYGMLAEQWNGVSRAAGLPLAPRCG